MIKNISAVIHSGDNNNWIWPMWKFYYKKYWHLDKIPTIFISEDQDIEWDKIQNIKSGKSDWSTGLKNALNEINSKYIIYFHEDFFLVGDPDYTIIKELVETMEQYNINLIKCCGKSAGAPCAPGNMIESHIFVYDRFLNIYPNHLNYLVSHQVSIWNKEFFKSTLVEGESPWAHELNGTKRLKDRNINIYAWCSDLDDPNCLPIPYNEAITKGNPRTSETRELINNARKMIKNEHNS